MNEAITQSLIGRINEAHGKCQQWAKSLSEAAIHSINAARETGIYLLELQEQTPHGKWLPLFGNRGSSVAVFAFSDDTARLYIKLANAMPDPIKTLPEGVRHLKDMLIAVEALGAPTGHGDQTRHEPRSPFQSLVKFAGEMQACLSTWRKDKPVAEWDLHLLEQVDSQIEPVVKFQREVREAIAKKS